MDDCPFYFHEACQNKLKASIYYKKVNSDKFVCPSHYCGSCRDPIDPENDELVNCVR
jgi:hypothetical protein